MTALNAGEERVDFGRVTGRMFDLIGRNFISFFVLAVIFASLPSIVLGLMLSKSVFDTEVADSDFLLFTLVGLVFSTILQGALTRASLDDLRGRRVSLKAAFATGLNLFLPLLGLGILTGLGILFGLFFFIIPGLILLVRWMVAAPALVAERPGISGAMERSAKLSEGHRWAIFGLAALYALILVIFTFISGALTGGLGGLFGTPAGFIVEITLDALMSMISTVGVASVYFELRQIKEGVSVAEIASVFE